MIIDGHIHVGTWDHPDFLGRAVSLTDALKVMKEARVSGAAVCPTDQCKNQELIEEAKDCIADGFSGPLWMFPWMRPIDHAKGQSDLEFLAANSASICGVKIHPSLSRQPISGDGFAPVLEWINRNSKMVLVHCGRWQEVASYRFAVEAACRYPQAKFLLAHGGGDTPPLSTAAAELVAAEAVDNVWFEFSGLREFWVIERNVRLLGADRYLMGSDFNLAHPLMYIGSVNGMALKDQEKERILGGNALELFGAPLAPREAK